MSNTLQNLTEHGICRCMISAELVRSKNNFFAEFEGYYATKRAIKLQQG